MCFYGQEAPMWVAQCFCPYSALHWISENFDQLVMLEERLVGSLKMSGTHPLGTMKFSFY